METNMWVDIVFFAVLAIFLIVGLWKGFIDSILSLVSTGVALVVAILVAKPASAFINKIINLPAWFEKMLAGVMKEESVSLFGSSALTFTKQQFAAFLAIVASVIIVFILIKLAIWLLAKLFDSVVKNSTIGSGLNRVLGGLFGLVRGGVVVIVVLALLSVLSGTGILGNNVQTTMDKAKVTGYVYKYVSETTEKYLEKADIKEYVESLVKGASETETTTE